MKYHKGTVFRIIILISFVIVIMTLLIVFLCIHINNREWWERTGSVKVRFFDNNSLTEEIKVDFNKLDKGIEFQYTDRGEENLPQAYIIYKNNELDLCKITNKQIYSEFDEAYILTPFVKGIGEFKVDYEFYKNKDTHRAEDLIKTVQINIIIRQEE